METEIQKTKGSEMNLAKRQPALSGVLVSELAQKHGVEIALYQEATALADAMQTVADRFTLDIKLDYDSGSDFIVLLARKLPNISWEDFVAAKTASYDLVDSDLIILVDPS